MYTMNFFFPAGNSVFVQQSKVDLRSHDNLSSTSSCSIYESSPDNDTNVPDLECDYSNNDKREDIGDNTQSNMNNVTKSKEKNEDSSVSECLTNIESNSADDKSESVLSDDESINDFSSSDDSEDSEDSELEGDDCSNDNNFFNRIMFASSQLSIKDVIIQLCALSLRYHFSDEAKLEVANLLKHCAGPELTDVNLSLHNMEKCFSSQKEYITYCYFCSECYDQELFCIKATKKIKNESAICKKCSLKHTITATSKNYVTQIDLEHQIQQLLENEKILKDLTSNLVRQEKEGSVGNIRDVHDGNIYKKMKVAENDSDYWILSVNVNGDGAPFTKSGKNGFWPFQMILNDLSPKLRFRYLLLSGIMATEKEPNPAMMHFYLNKVLVEPVNNIYNKSIIINRHGIEFKFKICVTNANVDSVARPVMQNRISFSGYFGCSWCYIHGTHIDKCGIHYLMKEKMVERTHESHTVDVKVVDFKVNNGIVDRDSKNRIKKTTTARGVKGSSAMQSLRHIDMVWSFPFEKLHGLFFGPAHQLWTEWRSSDCKYKIDPKHVKEIEKRFLSITPTQEVHRLPRSGIILGTSKPKASELQSWVHLYSLPCLEGILDDEAFQHYVLLVKSSYVLSKLDISEDELNEVDGYLKTFVKDYEKLYGSHRMTFNVHSLLHAVKSVRESGPLSVNSAFPFESHIFNLKQFVTGPKGMDKQIAKKHLQNFVFTSGNAVNLQVSESAVKYCNYLYAPKRLQVRFESCQDITFCGPSSLKIIDSVGYVSYKKCIINNTKFHSIFYKLAKKTDDTVIKLRDGRYARIINILKKNNSCLFQLSPIKVYEQDPFPPVNHIKKIESENEDEKNYFIEFITEVDCKVNLMEKKNGRFLGLLPNSVEIQ